MLRIFTISIGILLSICSFGQINSGNPSVPFGSNVSYDYGMMPTNLPASGSFGRSSDAATAYNNFVRDFVEDCTNNRARVKFDQEWRTVSEGIAYTMLLASYAADQNTFNKLWAYYKSHRNNNGVMNWRIDGCNNVSGQNGATDAELDAAMALIIADRQWGSTGQVHDYKNDAITLIDIILRLEVNGPSNNRTFNNGDGWGDANGCRNPSYQSPAYARVYKLFLEENGQNSSGWSEVADGTVNLLINNSGQTNSGLPSNWSLDNGQPNNSCSASGTTPFSFGFDACRAPWREGTDYLWFGSESTGMQTIINTQADFWIGRGGANEVQGGNSFGQNGNGSGFRDNNSFLGMVGAQSLASSTTNQHQNFVNDLYTKNKNVNNSNYFSQVLKCIGLFVQTGNFWNPYSSTISGDNSLPTVSITSPSNGFITCLGVDFTVTANANDIDGQVTRVEFLNNGTVIGTDNSSPYSYDFTDAVSGIYDITARAYDDQGAITLSSTVRITINSTQSSDGSTCDDIVVSDEFHAFIDDFDSEDPVSINGGEYGVFWWTDGADNTNTYEITRTNSNMTVALNNASPTYKVFGVAFGDDKFINLADFANADIEVDITNNSNQDVYLEVQLQDEDGNKAEYFIDDASSITWDNRWQKIGVEIPRGQRVNTTIDLSSVPDMLGGFAADGFPCTEAVNCPAVEYQLDVSRITQLIFIVNGGAGTTDNPDYSPATGDLVFNYFSLGETANSNSNIIEAGAIVTVQDSDNDGVPDSDDLCPFTDPGLDVDVEGCEVNGVASAISLGINIFPNPAKELLNIDQLNFSMNKVNILDLRGLEVLSQELTTDTESINISNLSNGTYLMILSGDQGSVQQRLIVK